MDSNKLKEAVLKMRLLAIDELKRTYLPEERLFAFHLHRTPEGIKAEGKSRRYTAMSLIGLAETTDLDISEITQGKSLQEVCGHLLDQVSRMVNPGDVAITLWAARAVGHPDFSKALDRLKEMDPVKAELETVWLAWSLAAVSVGEILKGEEAFARNLMERLLKCFNPVSRLFPHWPQGLKYPRWRAHISDFADQVYPIQALSFYARSTGNEEAATAARWCAEQICNLQGSGGQWWWHYDLRTGRVVEKYPVYSVHQDAMGPMALFAAREATDLEIREPIKKSIRWMVEPPEISFSLIDEPSSIIWRKVCRKEPNRLVRGLQAGVTWIHPALRFPGTDLLFPPAGVDYESRPYHMGWLLYSWPKERLSFFSS